MSPLPTTTPCYGCGHYGLTLDADGKCMECAEQATVKAPTDARSLLGFKMVSLTPEQRARVKLRPSTLEPDCCTAIAVDGLHVASVHNASTDNIDHVSQLIDAALAKLPIEKSTTPEGDAPSPPHTSEVGTTKPAGHHIAFNINDYVRVKLTDNGRKRYAEHTDMSHINPKYGPRAADEVDGWSRWQLWDLMAVFGPGTTLGSPLMFETAIAFEVTAAEAGELLALRERIAALEKERNDLYCRIDTSAWKTDDLVAERDRWKQAAESALKWRDDLTNHVTRHKTEWTP